MEDGLIPSRDSITSKLKEVCIKRHITALLFNLSSQKKTLQFQKSIVKHHLPVCAEL